MPTSPTSGAFQHAIRALVLTVLVGGVAAAQGSPPTQGVRPDAPAPTEPVASGVPVPAEYVIGPSDVLGINFWRDAEMTGDVTVRPDGRITLPLIGDLNALGLTPGQLKSEITKAASNLIKDLSVTVIVRAINSRRVFVTGRVENPGAYPLTGPPLTVMQAIALAGGLTEYADRKNITIIRTEKGRVSTLTFNYSEVSKGRNVSQNILLQPGDTVVVP
jgi:polysaccharide export outer membrane protein